MKLVVSLFGLVCLLATFGLLVAGLVFSKTQGDQMVYGIYAIATGILSMILLEASKDTTQV